MAPRPDSTNAPSQNSNSNASQRSVLPGMKRGIAIGVAACVAILLIAGLAYFAVKRRKRLAKAREEAELEANTWPQEKDAQQWHAPPHVPEIPPVEADAHTIHELDASQIPELPTTKPAPQELEGDERDVRISQLSGLSHEQKLQEWKKWSVALQAEDEHEKSREPETERPTTRRDIPILSLSVSPPDSSLSPFGVSPLGASPLGVSPGGVSSVGSLSPMEEAHFLPGRRSISDDVFR